MDDAPRQALRDLIQKYGLVLLEDERRLEGLLRDYVGSYRREITLLVAAVHEGVPRDLLDRHTAVPAELRLPSLVQRLEDNRAISAEAARWAVDVWADALGVPVEALGPPEEEAPPLPDEQPPPRRNRVRLLAGIGALLVLLLPAIALAVMSRGSGGAAVVPRTSTPAVMTATEGGEPSGSGATAETSPVELRITSSAPRSTVLLDGVDEGEAPRTLHLAPGEYQVSVSAPTYRLWQRSVHLDASEGVVAVSAAPEPLAPLELLEVASRQLGKNVYRDERGTLSVGTATDTFLPADSVSAVVQFQSRAYQVRDFSFKVQHVWRYADSGDDFLAARPLVSTIRVPQSQQWAFTRACAPAAGLPGAAIERPYAVDILIEDEVVAHFDFRITRAAGSEVPSGQGEGCEDPAGGPPSLARERAPRAVPAAGRAPATPMDTHAPEAILKAEL